MNKFGNFLKNYSAIVGMIFGTLLIFSFFHAHPFQTEHTHEAKSVSVKDSPAYIDDAEEEIITRALQNHPWIAFCALLVVVGGIWANGYVFKRKLKKLPVFADATPVAQGHWGVRDVVFIFTLLYFIEALCLFVEYWIFEGVPLKDSMKDRLTLLNTLIRDISVAAYVVWFVRVKLGLTLASIGLHSKKIGKHILTGFFAYLAVIPWLLLILTFLTWLTEMLNYEAPAQPALELFFKKDMESYMVYFSLFVAVLGPAIEEIFFRGFTYTGLRSKVGVRWGLFLSSLIFALLHLNLIAFLPIFVLGLYLGYLYEKTGSLIPSMTVHITHNFLMVVITLSIKSVLS